MNLWGFHRDEYFKLVMIIDGSLVVYGTLESENRLALSVSVCHRCIITSPYFLDALLPSLLSCLKVSIVCFSLS